MARTSSLSTPAAVLVVVLLATSLVVAPADAAPLDEPPGDCLPTLTTSELQVGEVGTGWTVSQGRDPEPFSIEVLGVVPNGVAPDRDLIVVETSSPAIDEVGGIWSGMSGSPVLVERDGEAHLIGAVAYGYSLGPNQVAGLTPAADLVDLAQRPENGAVSGATATVTLDDPTREMIAAQSGVASSRVDASMQRLPVPFSLSPHPARGPELVEQLRQRSGTVNLVPYATGAQATTSTGPTDDPAPGDNFAAVLSTGDMTAGGIGTTSYVCDGRAVAFGHPFLGSGATTMGAYAAEALTIIGDPTFGPYKLANVAENIGTVDQDRLAGLRALLGVAPPTTPVTSSVRELDGGRQRDGRTDVHHTALLADLAMLHVQLNIDTVFDRLGGGSSLVSSTISGTRQGGEPWSVEVGNRHVSPSDIGFESVFDLFFDVLQLDTNAAEAVQITSVDVDVEVEVTERTYEIRGVLVQDEAGTYVPPAEATLQAGQTEQLRIVLRRVDRVGGRLVTTPDEVEVDLELAVPDDVPDTATLEVTAGPGTFVEDPMACLLQPGQCPTDDDLTFDDVLEAIAARPRNDDLVVRLLPAGAAAGEQEAERFDPASGLALAETRHRLDRVGVGSVAAEVTVEPPQPSAEAPGTDESGEQ